MKISADTIETLKNFASINQSLVFKEGDEQKTVQPQKTILAKVKVVEDFPKEFAIYDLKQFLNVIKLFEDPELEFFDSYVTISSGEESVNYRYADASLIVKPPAKDIAFPTPEVEFTISSAALEKIITAGSVLGVPEVAIVGQDGALSVRALNSKESEGNNYQFKIGDTDLEFKAIFKTENLKLLPDEYTVSVSSKGLSRFKSDKSEYFIAIEASSVFN